MPKVGRRALVLLVMVGYPVFVAAWLLPSALGIAGPGWVLTAAVLGLVIALGAFSLYQFRRSMAQSPDALLDERQIAIRDRAYLESYRVLSVIVLFGLLLAGILPDLLDRPIALTYDTVQPIIWGLLLYSLILPSAVVAWREPDHDPEA